MKYFGEGILRRIPVYERGGEETCAWAVHGGSEVEEEEQWSGGGSDINIWSKQCSSMGGFFEGIVLGGGKIPR